MAVLSYSPLAGGWLSGRYRKDTDQTGPTSVARQRLANRFDLSLPENQRKLDAADQLAKLADEAGISLIEMAIAFVLRHPAITAPIIGPRTMDHLESQLAAAEILLTDDVLNRGVCRAGRAVRCCGRPGDGQRVGRSLRRKQIPSWRRTAGSRGGGRPGVVGVGAAEAQHQVRLPAWGEGGSGNDG